MHTCSQEESERLTLLTYIRDTPTSGPGELACSRSVLLHVCTNCPVWLAVTSSLSEDRVPAQASRRKKFALQFHKTFFYIAHFFCYFRILLVDTSIEPHCLSSAVTGFPCTPYGPLCMMHEAKALSTTIWFKKGSTDWPHFLLLLSETLIKNYYPRILLSDAHNLMTAFF